MNTQRTDFLVGLFLLVSVGVVTGAVIVTSGLGEERYDLFMRAASAAALTQDTRVVLQGLSVGRVRQVSPVLEQGNVSFIVRLSMQDRFPNGAELQLPGGTRAVLSQPTPIAPLVIELQLPDNPPPGIFMQPGDTLVSERPPDVLDALSGIATDLNAGLKTTLEDTRALMERTNAAITQAQDFMRQTGPLVQQALTRLNSNLERTDALIADIGPRVGPLQDSIAATLADTRRLLSKMDTLVTTAHSIASTNEDVIRETADLLLRAARIMEHFADQVSRRPTRLLTGVRPPEPDSSKGQP